MNNDVFSRIIPVYSSIAGNERVVQRKNARDREREREREKK